MPASLAATGQMTPPACIAGDCAIGGTVRLRLLRLDFPISSFA